MIIEVPLSKCKSIAREIEPDAFGRVRCGRENWRYYQTMVVFLFGTLNGIHDKDELNKITKISKSIISVACENLASNGIWKDGVAYVDLDDENAWMEIILCTMAATGELRRETVEPAYPVPALPLQAIPALQILEQRLLKQTLDEIRINKMERERKPYEFKKFTSYE